MAFLLSMMGFRLWSEICLIVSTTTANTIVGNETDRLALPAFKTMITQDPHGIVNSWNNSDHFCEWKGVRCSHRHKGVTIIDLQFRDLVGSLSPHIGNLSLLHELRLNNNTFQGEIPAEIGNLFRLQKLNLSINNFEGEILANLSRCSNLTYLGVGFKNLVGKFPEELTSLSKLIYLGIHLNNLTRGIPPFIGNLTSLVRITAAYNPFGGSIPDTLGQLKNLNFLGLGVTQFCGMIPSSIYNLSLLTTFSIPYNQLHGSLPPGFGSMFPPSSNPPAIWQPIYWTSSTFNIQFFRTTQNHLFGSLPADVGNLKNLMKLDISENGLSGEIPSSLGSCTSLENLYLVTEPPSQPYYVNLCISNVSLPHNGFYALQTPDFHSVFVLKHPLVPSAVFGSTKLWQLQQVLDAFKIESSCVYSIELVNTHTGIDQLIEDGPKLDSLTISSITVVNWLLQEFVEKHGNGFEVVSTLSGWWKNNPSVYHIRLVSGPKLLESKQEFNGNYSVQVYSVQACIPKDPTALWNAEFVQAEELLRQPSTIDNCL
ncbi:putative receptor-like protein kinase At3g47110 [Camellia sinensis]|uniref:putative receptor-like protein kinase At3g47110 n=1 Tax=Camellia sinensis TaxID=4442 RepID=UPI0010358BA6|nr:putative receptor-like protein kinase At3g47110 [Camellia sinensis]